MPQRILGMAPENHAPTPQEATAWRLPAGTTPPLPEAYAGPPTQREGEPTSPRGWRQRGSYCPGGWRPRGSGSLRRRRTVGGSGGLPMGLGGARGVGRLGLCVVGLWLREEDGVGFSAS